jgi:hypothetical protein
MSVWKWFIRRNNSIVIASDYDLTDSDSSPSRYGNISGDQRCVLSVSGTSVIYLNGYQDFSFLRWGGGGSVKLIVHPCETFRNAWI